MSLKDRLARDIAELGPMTVAEYMTRCLHDPRDGYYATRPRIGADGDFITAPMVSQMFGELLGLWAAEVWMRMGSPARVILAEMGPGDGTLMEDLLRAARAAPGFLDAAEIVLIETSGPLIEQQTARLASTGRSGRWLSSLSALEPGPPLILIANEVLDCLPARQFQYGGSGWSERRVGLDDEGGLVFGLKPCAPPPGAPANLAPGLVWEVSDAQAALAYEIGARIARDGGAALLIDYGRAAPEPGDTLQALSAHRKVDPLEAPGEADLTVWADFPTVAAAARTAGAGVALTSQRQLLQTLGIDQRAQALMRTRPDRAELIARQLHRLTADDQMGALFKACAIFPLDARPPPGFEGTP